MPDETVWRTMLFDFYGELLTEKQREYYDLHYNQDLSLAEIAASSGISRQGVWDNIRRADAALRDAESRLGLVQRFAAQRTAAAALEDTLTKLRDCVGGDARSLAEQALRQLHAQGRKLAIVSNKPDEAVRALRAEFFADTVPIAVGEKQGIRRKPAPDTLLTAMAQLGAERTSTVYVGDSEVDIATARAAGLPCISVLWGFRDRDLLEQAGAQQFAADAGELASLLD